MILKQTFVNECKNAQPPLTTNQEVYHYLLNQGMDRSQILDRLSRLKITYLPEHIEPSKSVFRRFDLSVIKYKRILPFAEMEGTVVVIIDQLPTQSLREQISQFIRSSHELYFLLDFEWDQWFSYFEADENKPALEGADISSEVVEQVNDIIEKGIKLGASDIHIEPIEKSLKVRYRVDGLLSVIDTFEISPASILALVNRVKILSNMDISKKREPQDGRIESFKVNNSKYSFRVSSVNTNYGEKVVLRIFRPDGSKKNLSGLGLSEQIVANLRQAISNSNGILLLSGATGTGKTTTMYAMLEELDRDHLNVYTIEDPIERNLEGVNQIPIDPSIGVGFPEILRSLLRQDPDVIVVGEIRDGVTAELSVRASLTGHLVISTVHANNALESIERLIDMGIEPYLLSASLLGIASQRLVRQYCSHCKTERPISYEEKKWMIDTIDKYGDAFSHLKDMIPESIADAKGCAECNHLGYKGRELIAEMLVVTPEIQEFISKQKLGNELFVQSLQSGYKPLIIHGIEKILMGTTSMKEVLRVAMN